jgi:2-polyprenyl-3-methyl-5-hydroxy-6-metoxy-1,4-benzoquinol methylase
MLSSLRTKYKKYKKYKKSRDFHIKYILDLQKWGKEAISNQANVIKRPCPICRSYSCMITFEAPVYTFVQCQKCGLIYASDILNDAEIEKFYINNSIYQNGWAYSYDIEVAQKNLPTHTPLVNKILKFRTGQEACLEIGCGYGKLLFELKPHFSTVEGIELNEVTSAQGKKLFGIKIYTKKLEELNLSSEFYDVVILNQVIEHLNNLDLFEDIVRILKPNGIVCIACPNADSLSMKILKGKHIHVSTHGHINMFNHKSIRSLADNYGFNLDSFTITDFLDIDLNDIILHRSQNFVHRHSYSPLTLPLTEIISKINSKLLIEEKITAKLKCGSYLVAILRKK